MSSSEADLEVELADGAAEIGSVELAVHDVRNVVAVSARATIKAVGSDRLLFMSCDLSFSVH